MPLERRGKRAVAIIRAPKMMSKITSRAPAANNWSSMIAHTSRDHGNGRSFINCRARFPSSSSGRNGGRSSVFWSIPRKTKSGPDGSGAALALQIIFEALLARPQPRKEWHTAEPVPEQHAASAKRPNCGDHPKPMTSQPKHAAMLRNAPKRGQSQNTGAVATALRRRFHASFFQDTPNASTQRRGYRRQLRPRSAGAS
jgi:hypothetical protein